MTHRFNLGFLTGGHFSRPVSRLIDEDEAPFEMANLRPQTTGLPFVVFVSQQGGARHATRIKISNLPSFKPDQAATITLDHPPQLMHAENVRITNREFEQLKLWIELNREVIEGFWNGSIPYIEDLLPQIKAV
ncbi:hypothetical protein ACX4M5_00940 [Roseomonas mucosa]|uniref:hypothetical protein n=1 Tax=Roseomonas TaxID=125216 RepID=UPI000F805E35|nr:MULTISPECIES: hypothetical protein [Roseomonas]MDT8351802.1 hypothetical protein [Roseomonas mucosa]